MTRGIERLSSMNRAENSSAAVAPHAVPMTAGTVKGKQAEPKGPREGRRPSPPWIFRRQRPSPPCSPNHRGCRVRYGKDKDRCHGLVFTKDQDAYQATEHVEEASCRSLHLFRLEMFPQETGVQVSGDSQYIRADQNNKKREGQNQGYSPERLR